MAKEKNKKQYYRKLILEHKAALSKARRIIENLLDELQLEINSSANSKNEQSENCEQRTENFLFGEKDCASNIIVKLTGILLKLIPLEQEIARLDLSKTELAELEEVYTRTALPEEDMQIIEEYIKKWNEGKV